MEAFSTRRGGERFDRSSAGISSRDAGRRVAMTTIWRARRQTTLGANETVSVGRVHFSSVPRACSRVRRSVGRSGYAGGVRPRRSVSGLGAPGGWLAGWRHRVVCMTVAPAAAAPPQIHTRCRGRRSGCSNRQPASTSPDICPPDTCRPAPEKHHCGHLSPGWG